MKAIIAVCLVFLVSFTSADYLGKLCGTQWGIDHYYPTGGSKVEQCINFCHEAGYRFAGLIFGYECFCDQILNYPVCRPNDQDDICTKGNCSSTGFHCNSDGTMICGDTIWYSIYDAKENHNIITHWDTVVNNVCSLLDPTCSWYCYITDALYEFSTGQVIGTGDYDIDSSYCMSAVHDLRYIPNELTNVTVTRKEISKTTVEGSWRYGIQSTWKDTQYEFVVDLPSRAYVFDSSTLWGFADLAHQRFNCIRYGSSDNEPFAATLANVVQKEAVNVVLSDTTLLYCGLNKSHNRLPATYVPVVAEPNGHGGAVKNRTLTVKVGETLEINYETDSLSNGPWSVVKAGRTMVSATSDSTITLTRNDAQIPFQGFYELLDTNGHWQASVRVIVVLANVDLDKCGGFRGVPREDDTCLCFPPFGNANDCSGLCNPSKLDGTFGPSCDMKCGAGDNCKGLLICGEDPFGCHCASGWTGDGCTVECSTGTYGPDCKGHASGCHCLGIETGCSVITGMCPLGCVWGWFDGSADTACQHEGGYLNTQPYIIKVSFSSILVGWKAWVHIVDGGELTPDGYHLNVKKCSDSDSAWYNVSSIFPSGNSNYSYLVPNLDSLTCYDFRIQTVVQNVVMPKPSPVVDGTTICGSPTKTPSNLKGSSGTREIVVTWDWPSQSDWNCATTKIHCDYTYTYECNTETKTGSFEKTAPSSGGSSSQTVDVPDYSTTDFTCYLDNNGQHGPKASLDNQQPKTSTPPAVADFTSYSTAEGLLGTWNIPDGDAGYISAYNVRVVPQSSGGGPNVDVNVSQTRYLYQAAYSGEEYKFTIVAWNSLGAGESYDKTVEYSLPSGLW